MNAPHPVRAFKDHDLVADFARPGVRFERRPARTPEGKIAEVWTEAGSIRSSPSSPVARRRRPKRR